MRGYLFITLVVFSVEGWAMCKNNQVTVCGYKSKIQFEPLKDRGDYCVFGLYELTKEAKQQMKEKRSRYVYESLIAYCKKIPNTENFTLDFMCFDVFSKELNKFASDYYLNGRGVTFINSSDVGRCKGVKDFSVLID